ncbi:receptor-type tyrosine-protein phosphatase alpha-like isoform X2 [Mya arenaria]|uniref:receptor-type tyrosine-protein phosphatase alpha-like isoform X2 n=1 Tax=Mya arenaria TaxID=6604 RepID=UPI0022E204B6|nr:receptor-type tyrosine-protein phosphatase alpha-like isoform X2 [Mya arenaria]
MYILLFLINFVVCKTCPMEYSDRCENCTQSFCVECKAGYFNISSKCAFTCITPTCTCTNHYDCMSCKDGYYGIGNNCDRKCSSGCNGQPCDNNGTCLCKPYFTGNACDSCVDGMYGANCSMQCSRGCEGRNCSRTDGICTCSEYYSGEKCENCIAGQYGNDCSKPCSLGCLDSTCSMTDGKCDCKDFYKGAKCDVCVNGPYGDGCLNSSSNEQTEADKPIIGALVGGVIGAVLVVVTVVVAVIFLKRRKELCWKMPLGAEQHRKQIHTPQPVVYATVQKKRHSSVPAQQMESSRGNQAHQPHTSLTERLAETGNKLYEDISNGPDDSGLVQENVKQEAGHGVNMQTQHVELVMTDETTEDDGLEIDEDDQIARATAITFEEKGGIYYNNADKINKQKVAVNNLTKYVIEKTDIDIEEEFEKFPYGLTKSYDDSQKQGNIRRNRYKGIYPYNDTRVKLRDCETDYINASFIDGYKKRHAYIAALGPMSKQLDDFSPFWQMIWQEKVETIVMLTNLVEDGKDKCEQYWPDLGTSKVYGKVHVSSQSEDEYAEFTRREYTILKGSEIRQLHHLHFTCWPDKGVPDDVIGTIEFRQRVLNLPGQFDGPVLVHCSAGVGRTGTYIALDILTKEGEGEGSIHIPGCVINMRHDRANMIQTMSQYEFLYRALVNSLSDISKPIRGTRFRQYINQMGKKGFNRQFQEMQTVLEKPSGYGKQAMERNNRIKGDRNRPCRFFDSPPGAPECINAVYIESLKARTRFLVVQSPMKENVIDFLTLLSQEKCTCVVSFEPYTDKQKKQNVGLYFPSGDHNLKQGMFQVRCTKQENHGYCTKRLLTIKHNEHDEQSSEREVTHFEFNAWDYTSDVPKSSKDFLDLIKSVDANLRETSNRGPLLVHCLDGTGKSALFCVVSILVEKMKIDHEVSVVNTIRKVRSRRTSAIPNMAQFEFCHECVLSYIKSFDYSQYSNFTGSVTSVSTA